MTALTRLGDLCTGHGCHPPRHVQSGSNNVFTNGISTVRVSDIWEEHSCGSNTHNAVSSQGSSTVFINNLAAVRIGDMLSCGSASAQGSPTVFVG
jgi:uncharacterized Zn-binding protein involved in type VI secretion